MTDEWTQPEGEEAVSLIEGGIGPHRAAGGRARSIGAGAVDARVADLARDRGRGGGARARVAGAAVRGRARSRAATCARRPRPSAGAAPRPRTACRRRPSSRGAVVTVDTISHEGILDDQGRDPVAYFGRYGIAREQGAQRRARRSRRRRCEHDGPCVVSGPIAVRGAEPGRHPAGRRARARPARALRRGLQPPRRRQQRTTSRSSRRCAASTARLCRLVPVARRVPARPVPGDHRRRGRRADLQRRPRRRLEPVPAGARPGREVLRRRPALRAATGAFALEAPLRATFRLTVLPRGSAVTPTVAGLLGRRAPAWTSRCARAIGESLTYLGRSSAMPRALAFAYLARGRPPALEQALLAQLIERLRALVERLEPHAVEHRRRLGELDVAVVDDLDPVAPRVAEVQPPARLDVDLGLLERGADAPPCRRRRGRSGGRRRAPARGPRTGRGTGRPCR